jgi:hypothetical protein
MKYAKKLLTKADAYVDKKYPQPNGFNCKKLREFGNRINIAIVDAYCAGYKQCASEKNRS